jgi:hypothetical protein
MQGVFGDPSIARKPRRRPSPALISADDAEDEPARPAAAEQQRQLRALIEKGELPELTLPRLSNAYAISGLYPSGRVSKGLALKVMSPRPR